MKLGYKLWVTTLLLVGCWDVQAETPAPATPAAKPAVWAHHSLIVDLSHLPKRYTCIELWYKFKDVLSSVGAAPGMKILPYRCSQRVGALGYSPRVQVEFSTPRLVEPKDARWATLQAVHSLVQWQPRQPAHLEAGDCELVNQLRSTLLSSLQLPVTSFHLACQAPVTAAEPFGLTVRALMPLPWSAS